MLMLQSSQPIFEFSVVLDDFYLLLPTQLRVFLICAYSGGSMFYPLPHTDAWTAPNSFESSTTYCFWLSVSKLWKQLTYAQTFVSNCKETMPSDIFKVSAISCNSILRSFKAILCIQHHTAFKFSIPANNNWFLWCRVPIKLIKPLFSFNGIFPYQYQKFLSIHCFKN